LIKADRIPPDVLSMQQEHLVQESRVGERSGQVQKHWSYPVFVIAHENDAGELAIRMLLVVGRECTNTSEQSVPPPLYFGNIQDRESFGSSLAS
jgi:hypothetical protein